MSTLGPKFVATERITWLKSDGSEVPIVARVGTPYAAGDVWRCPVELEGVDSRYPDIAGESSMQAMSLAMRLIASRLSHLLAEGERLVYPGDRKSSWDSESLRAVFGALDDPDRR